MANSTARTAARNPTDSAPAAPLVSEAEALPPAQAARVADVLRSTAQPPANARDAAVVAGIAEFMASRRGLADSLQGVGQDAMAHLDRLSWLLTSIERASREEGTWAEALCQIGIEWCGAEQRRLEQLFESTLAPAIERALEEEAA